MLEFTDSAQIKIGEKEFDIVSLLAINKDNLSDEFAKHASMYAYFASILSTYEYKLAQEDYHVERVYADSDKRVRKSFQETGEKTTETLIKNVTISDKEYEDALEKLNFMKYRVSILKAIVKAFEQRGNMLISLGAHSRQELAGNLLMYETQTNDLKSKLIEANKKYSNKE